MTYSWSSTLIVTLLVIRFSSDCLNPMLNPLLVGFMSTPGSYILVLAL